MIGLHSTASFTSLYNSRIFHLHHHTPQANLAPHIMVAVPQSDLRSNILKVLVTTAAPKSSAAIHKALPVGGRPKTKALAVTLSEMADAGSIIEFPGKSAKYARAPALSWVEAMLLEQLAAGTPVPEDKLAKSLVPHQQLLPKVVKALERERKLCVHPPIKTKGSALYGTMPPDLLTYIGKDLQKLVAVARSKGFSPTAIRAALLSQVPESELKPKSPVPPPIAEAIRRLEPGADRGVAVSIAALRKALAADHDQASVDLEILALAKQAVVDLHSHPWVARLSSQEKRSLIEDGRGGWFDRVSLRGPA